MNLTIHYKDQDTEPGYITCLKQVMMNSDGSLAFTDSFFVSETR